MHHRHSLLRAAATLGLAGAAALGAAPAQAIKYRIQDLGTIQGGVGEAIQPLAINNAGTVVGTSTLISGATRVGAFIYENGSMRALKSTGRWAEGYTATDINDAGWVVGEFLDRPGRTSQPVLYRDGAVIPLGLAGGGSRDPVFAAINNAGVVVGRDDAGSFIVDAAGTRPLTVGPAGEPFSAQLLNDRGVIAGFHRNQYALTDGGTVTPLERFRQEPYGFLATDLNNQGQLLVQISVPGDGDVRLAQSYIYEAGRYRALGPLGPDSEALVARAFNDAGVAVGVTFAGSPDDAAHAFVWRDGRARDLNELIAPGAGGSNWVLSDAWDINERGQIVGTGRLEGSSIARGFIATPVPEGDTLALMLAGLAGLGWRLRRGVAAAAGVGRPGALAAA